MSQYFDFYLFHSLLTLSYCLFFIINLGYSCFIILCLSLLHSKVKQLHIYECCCCCSVTKSRPALCNPMDGSMPGLPVPQITRSLPKFMSIESVMLSTHLILCHPPPFAFNFSQHQGLFQWVGSLHQVAKVLKLKLQDLSFQWIFRVDFL